MFFTKQKGEFKMADYDVSTFSREGKIEDIKVGTKIWYMLDADIDQGTVSYVNSDKYYIDAFWERTYSCAIVFYSDFNKYWGIIVENKKQNKHKKTLQQGAFFML